MLLHLNLNGNKFLKLTREISSLLIKIRLIKKEIKSFLLKCMKISDFNDYGEKSSIIHHEVDCKNLKFKYLTDFYFKLPMGEGEPSFVGNEESDWIEVKEDTILKVLVSYVCN